MAELSQMQCEACRADAPRLSDDEIEQYMKEIPAWTAVERDGVMRLEREYKLKDFVTALALTNKIGALAEEEGHHPEIVLTWGLVGVSWWTHAIQGLHRNDFIMAARTEATYQQDFK
ncbi:4a-hydroxytetrahydrobiopterin dehydratase [Ktedonospora formicarum]|uniref:Putative pterin-4-alpha-carbinolamine dehydratase n=1 Tax=Ktedonospora formicarum TaxID=2778364 RepID=A0A8J3I475_9CHLR|nr:4a-hydroxytetrahydrobiopterin dehydratase [Ktedonospora formicarum]GHO45124.1 putative pterin-4-alpha-carbinolamine dehydratase [Ktedonospora formicarum]